MNNRLICGDNLEVMRSFPDECINLIYVDPPFFSGRNYTYVFNDSNEIRSFKDVWHGGMSEYLDWLMVRIREMRRLLKNIGLIYVHLDWHAVHYVKVEMDKLFGMQGFRNHIIWSYGLGGSSPQQFSRKHDDILLYSKGHNWYFDPPMVSATSQRMKGQLKKISDVIKVPTINNMAHERIGYPTQKPEALLNILIKAASPENAIVADFFCGGGTTIAVAEKTKRRWVGCDISPIAIQTTKKRVSSLTSRIILEEFFDGKSEKTKIQET